MKTSSVISILMPVKNAEPFLESVLNSIRNQTYTKWELIAVNDHSSDKSHDILEGYFRRDSRIKVYQNKSEGIVPALDLAFQQSTGTYITRMDADDIMPPQKLECLLKKMNGRSKTVVTGKVKYFSEGEVSSGYKRYENWLNQLVLQENHYDHIYRECIIASPNWLVDRSCFECDILIQDLNYPEDYDMVFKWKSAGYTIDSVEKVTHLWREHPDRTSRNSVHYQQKAFFNMKTSYFINNHHPFTNAVQLIGNGQKARMVKAIFEENNIPFEQYDVKQNHLKIKGVDALKDRLSILTNWPTAIEKQTEITDFLSSKGLYFGKNLWLF